MKDCYESIEVNDIVQYEEDGSTYYGRIEGDKHGKELKVAGRSAKNVYDKSEIFKIIRK